MKIIIKPNLVSAMKPESAATTHPVLLCALAEMLTAKGAEVIIGDSPGGRTTPASARALFQVSGMAAVAEEEGARLVLLDDDVVRRPAPGGRLYTSFNLGREAVDADVLINVPRLKTHGFMQMTGGVKNLFGCIPGLEKAQFHVKVPDRDDFADMLVDLLLACHPALTIMDGIIGMEGEGPSAGRPKQIGALLASPDAPALDVVAASIAGFDPMDVYTVAAAHRRGLCPSGIAGVDVRGADWREVAPATFDHPARDITRSMPPALRRWARARVSSKPVLGRPLECTGCRTCERNCPVHAIVMKNGKPTFDYEACIRCYCCQELCPEHAIDLKSPWFVRSLVLRGGSKRA
jgi:uncharacterized protein (DUF362 family)